MNTKRWLVVAALGLFGCAWAQADSEPGHYTITLTDWDPNQHFTFQPFSDPDPNDAFNTSDFTNPVDFCVEFSQCFDPSIRLNSGGGSQPESGTFSFSTGDGNQVVVNNVVIPGGNFQNTGAPINEILLTLTDDNGDPIDLPQDQLFETFVCESDIFQHCGFFNDAFEIAFWNDANSPAAIDTVTTPEPAQWIVMLGGCLAVMIARKRKALASSLAPTQR